jgi:pyruvate dehydrogenase E1 component beta subunit
VREGSDVTLVATQLMREEAIKAADKLGSEGISVEVIDPRMLVPFEVYLKAGVSRTRV